jgi:L-ribulokinase
MNSYIIGLDYGTDSVRAVLLDSSNGNEIATDVFWYPRWAEGKYCTPNINQFRQHPLDLLEGLESTLKNVITTSKVDPNLIKGICIDTTGSSPIPLDSSGNALALNPKFAENPNAMMVLWKDHTAIKEAESITKIAKSWGGEDYTKYIGGIYSSEWFWAKIWHIHSVDNEVATAVHTWMEHCDWMTFTLIEDKNLDHFKRSRCAAGHKAMWHESWGGLPSTQFLSLLDPTLSHLRSNLYSETYTSDVAAGNLSKVWSEKLGLSQDTIISVGTFDAHAGAVGAGITEKTLVRVMGTSTCDIMIAQEGEVGDKTIRGICGQVNGSVVPNYIGLEAGQSGFGDVLAWFKNLLSWPLHQFISNHENEKYNSIIQEIESKIIENLTKEAILLDDNINIPIALDWLNGRRTPDANQNLKTAIEGLSLGSSAPVLFKSLVYAICFGSKKILDRFEDEGIEINQVVGIGGVARKSGYIMQCLADTLNKKIEICQSDYAPALGAAIYAATASGLYNNLSDAIQNLASPYEKTYNPDPSKITLMSEYYEKYCNLATYIESK